MPLFNLATLASYRSHFLRTLSTFVKPEQALPISQFKILDRITELHKAGKNAVYVTEHQQSGKTFFLKDISDSEKYHIPYRKACEEGRPTDGIYPDALEQKFFVQNEVFATRIMNLFLGDEHTPRSIYPVIRNEGGKISYLVASESVGDFVSLIQNDFYIKTGKTMIKIDNEEYETSGRLAVKIAHSAIGDGDGNAQNVGVVKNGTKHLKVVTIDHEHGFQRRIDSYEQELQNLLRANVFTPFGKKMDFHQEDIHRRDLVRLNTIQRIAGFLEDGKDIRRIFQTTFSLDHLPHNKKRIQHIITHLGHMRGVFNKAAEMLSRNTTHSSPTP